HDAVLRVCGQCGWDVVAAHPDRGAVVPYRGGAKERWGGGARRGRGRGGRPVGIRSGTGGGGQLGQGAPGGPVRGPCLAPWATGEVFLDRHVVRIGELAQQEFVEFAVAWVRGGHGRSPCVVPFQGVLPF